MTATVVSIPMFKPTVERVEGFSCVTCGSDQAAHRVNLEYALNIVMKMKTAWLPFTAN